MLLEISQKELLSILAKVNPTVSSSKMVPLYACFCFKNNKVATYNGTAGTTTGCRIEDADFAVEAKRFYDVIRSMPLDAILLKLEEGKLHITSGNNRTWLNVHPTRGFPDVIPQDCETYSEAQNLVAGLKALSFCVCNNAMKPYLMGIAVCRKYLYASDGVRISRYELDKSVPKPITLPTAAVEQFVKLGQPDLLFTAGTNIGGLWKSTRTIYSSQVIAHSFPVNMVEEMIEKLQENPIYAEFPGGLEAAVKRVNLLAASDERELTVEYKNKELKISTSSNEVGASEESLDWDFDQEFKFLIKPWFFEQGLSRTRRVDLSDIINGERRLIRFTDGPLDHVIALMY